MLTIANAPGKVFQRGEKVDNDKLNLLGNPVLTVSGGLEASQARLDSFFYYVATGAANAYVVTCLSEDEDPTSYGDGMVVAFKVPVVNTGASTLKVVLSDGTQLVAVSIQKRGRDVAAGDLAANRIYTVRYESGAGVWLLGDWGAAEPGDITGAGLGTDNASSSTAYAVKLDPSPAALVAGQWARFAAPLTCGAHPTLKIQTAAGVDIGAAVSLKRVKGDGTLAQLEAGDIRSGAVVQALYTGTEWLVTSETGRDFAACGGGLAVNGLVLTNNAGTPATKIDISGDDLWVASAAGGGARVIGTNFAMTVDIAVNGVNGLDTGTASAAVATWYYVWVIWGAGQAVAGLLSLSKTAPTLPANYTHAALAGAVNRSAGNSFPYFLQRGKCCWIAATQIFSAKGAAVANTYEVLAGGDLTAFQNAVPDIAKVVTGYAGGVGGALGGCMMCLAADVNGVGEVMLNIPENTAYGAIYAAAGYRVPMKAGTRNLAWKNVDVESQNVLFVNGFEL